MAKITYLQLYIQHCRIEALINDIVVIRKNVKDAVTTGVPIHEFLISGENSAELKVLPYDEFGFNPDAKVEMRVAEFNEGDFLEFDGGDEKAGIQLSINNIDEQDLKKFYSNKVSFSSSNPGKWVWQNLGVLSLNEHVLKSLNSFIGSIHKDFQERKPANILALSKIQIEELARCYPMETADMREQDLLEYVTDPDNEEPRILEPLKLENLAYRLAAGGRLIECIGKDGLPLIRTVTANIDDPGEDENYLELPMHIGFVDNQFQIIR